jgi:hypothetical protein
MAIGNTTAAAPISEEVIRGSDSAQGPTPHPPPGTPPEAPPDPDLPPPMTEPPSPVRCRRSSRRRHPFGTRRAGVFYESRRACLAGPSGGL